MKAFAVEQLPQELVDLLETAQTQRVLLTRNGVPYAVLVGVDQKDDEDFQLETSPEFWQMIEERRRETDTVSLEEVVAELEAEEKRSQNGEVEPGVNQPTAEKS